MAINKVRVTGEIHVPATGVELVTNGNFANWDDANMPTSWDISSLTVNAETSEVAFNEGHGGIGSGSCNIWTDDKSAVSISQDNIFTIGKRYRLSYDVTVIGGELSVTSGNQSAIYDTVSSSEIGRTIEFTAASDLRIRFIRRQSFNCDVTIDNISVLELTAGPTDTYSSSGTHNGQIKYTSNSAHADGVGGSETWDIWWDNVSDWILSPEAGTEGPNYWSLTDSDIVGDYTENGLAAGTATVSEAGGGFRGRYSSGGRYAGQGRYQGSGRY